MHILIPIQITLNLTMNSIIKSLLLLALPLLMMTIINESQRSSIPSHDFQIYGANTMNTVSYDKSSCTWACHNSTTQHCKVYHATCIAPYFKWIDPIYFGIIKGLHSTGDYGLANVILLVFVWPLFIGYLSIRILQMRKQINNG